MAYDTAVAALPAGASQESWVFAWTSSFTIRWKGKASDTSLDAAQYMNLQKVFQGVLLRLPMSAWRQYPIALVIFVLWFSNPFDIFASEHPWERPAMFQCSQIVW